MWRWTVAALLILAACGGEEVTAVSVTPGSVDAGTSAGVTANATEPVTPGCADVVEVVVEGSGPYTFAVTVSSPDSGWDKYADEWRIVDAAGSTIGVRELTHPHVDEQPFTRSLPGVSVAAGATLEVSARDSVEGYCGASVSVTVGS